MVLFLLNTDDAPGRWLAHSLQQASEKPIKLISLEELVYAPEFTCGFRDGQAFFSITLHSGYCFRSDTATPIINRINYLKLPHLSQFRQEDQAYVHSELQAVFTFLFSSFSNNIFNTPSGRGLCGANRSPAEWRTLGDRSGFETSEVIYQEKTLYCTAPSSPIYSVVVFDNKCFSVYQLSEKTKTSCLSLLKLSNEKIIEIYLASTGEKAHFVGATVQPSFAHINNQFIHHLNQLL